MTSKQTIKKNTTIQIVASSNDMFEIHYPLGNSYRWGLSLDETIEYLKHFAVSAQDWADTYERERQAELKAQDA